MSGNMNLTLKVWRQQNAQTPGKMVTYKAENISPDMSFLEMLDVVNESLTHKGEDPIHFDHDCREGICGMCSLYINGQPHGPKRAITTCQLHMRSFHDGQTITIEPWRAAAFPKDSTRIKARSSPVITCKSSAPISRCASAMPNPLRLGAKGKSNAGFAPCSRILRRA